MGGSRIPRWRWWLALALGAALIAWVALDWHRFREDFWPPDRSVVGPNIVAEIVVAIVLLVIGAIVWPPTRRYLLGLLHAHLVTPIHDRLAEHFAGHREHLKREIAQLRREQQERHDELLRLHAEHDRRADEHATNLGRIGRSLAQLHETVETARRSPETPTAADADEPSGAQPSVSSQEGRRSAQRRSSPPSSSRKPKQEE